MSKPSRKPILVTGSHRSGSTWVGRMIALSPSVAYIHEPFNLRHRPGICKAKFDFWFTYICSENEQIFFNDLNDCVQFKFNFKEELKSVSSARDTLRMLRDYLLFTKYRLFPTRPVIKDPIAVFSADWLAKNFDMDVILLIRHPAAFVGSLKQANWTHPFDHFLQQPLLMEQHLSKFRSEIIEYSKEEKNIVDQAILLWNIINHMVLNYQINNPGWNILKHEELSKHPVETFSNLYKYLNLDFSKPIQEKILSFSQEDMTSGKFASLMRNSKANIMRWKTRLTNDEIRKIKAKTQEIADRFYTEEDWGE